MQADIFMGEATQLFQDPNGDFTKLRSIFARNAWLLTEKVSESAIQAHKTLTDATNNIQKTLKNYPLPVFSQSKIDIVWTEGMHPSRLPAPPEQANQIRFENLYIAAAPGAWCYIRGDLNPIPIPQDKSGENPQPQTVVCQVLIANYALIPLRHFRNPFRMIRHIWNILTRKT